MPKAPTNVRASDITATSATLNWEPAEDDSAGTIESYIVQYRRKYSPGTSYDEISDILDTEFVVTGLNPYTTYEIRIIAVNNIGRGLPSKITDVPTGETSKKCCRLIAVVVNVRGAVGEVHPRCWFG